MLSKDKTKKIHAGGWQKDWLKEKINKMLSIPIVFESAYTDTDGTIQDKESFTLLNKVEMFNRKLRTEYRNVSYFQIHPVIVKSILDKYVKPLRIDVLLTFRKEISWILYKWIDLMLFKQDSYSIGIAKLAQEQDFGAERQDHFLEQIRDAAVELEGKELSSGKLVYCKVEKTVDNESWKLVLRKGKYTPELLLPAVLKQDTEINNENQEFTEYLAKWKAMEEPLKSQLWEKAKTISQSKTTINFVSNLSIEIELVELLKDRDKTPI
jgi:hypothetical protein